MSEDDQEQYGLWDVILYTGNVERINGDNFKETKIRPAVIILKDEVEGAPRYFAAPINSTAKDAWCGPKARYCIEPTKKYVEHLLSLSQDQLEIEVGLKSVRFDDYNNLKEISQVAVSNLFVVTQKCYRGRFGKIENSDREILNYMVRDYREWLHRGIRACPRSAD